MRRLTVERERRGWSRAELARQAAMNAATVGLIERGRLLPYPQQVRKLAAALGVEEAGLLDEVKPEREPEREAARAVATA